MVAGNDDAPPVAEIPEPNARGSSDMLESAIEQKANGILKEEGWKCLKVKFSEKGWPDRLYIHLSGVIVWIEWKRLETQTEPYPLQYERLEELIGRKQWATWTDTLYDGIWYCRHALVAEGIPSGRYQNATGTRSSSFVPGPWPWENELSASGAENPTRAYIDQ